MRTALTERYGLTVPVVGAPMAGPAGGRLAAAVSAAGALGMVGVGSAAPPGWVTEQAGIAASGGWPYGIGLQAWALPGRPDQLAEVLSARPALVSVSYGPYEQFLPALRDAGVTTATQVGNLEEALAAARAGVDVVVARGGEGGGHGRNDVATLPLLQEVLDAVAVPVLAAGGIATARGLAAVLAAGAAGAWVGTAFLACTECDSSPAAQQRLLGTPDTGTAYGRVFDIARRQGWPPEYGGRALRNSFSDRWTGREDELAQDPGVEEQVAAAARADDFDVAVLYAGQGVALLREQRPAADVVAELAGAEDLLRRAGGGLD